MKQIIRITESELRRMIQEAVTSQMVGGNVDRFTPRTDQEEIERNRRAWETPSNPSYDEWRRKNQKNKK